MTSNPRALDAATRAHHASRTVVVGLLAAVWSLAFPSAAHASLLSPEAEDAMANFLAIFVLFVVPVVLIVLSDHQQALTVVQTQFKVGSTDLRFVEQRQLALSATRSALIRVQAEQRVQRVNLHLALGGSFELPPQAPTTAASVGAPPSR